MAAIDLGISLARQGRVEAAREAFHFARAGARPDTAAGAVSLLARLDALA